MNAVGGAADGHGVKVAPIGRVQMIHLRELGVMEMTAASLAPAVRAAAPQLHVQTREISVGPGDAAVQRGRPTGDVGAAATEK